MADMMSPAPADKMGEKPASDVTPKKLVDKLYEPAVQKSMESLKQVIDDNGFPMKAESLFIVAQMDSRTQGKSPAELADMLKSDPSLFDDLEALDSGKADKMKADMGIKPEKKSAEAPPTEGLPIPPDEAKMNFDQKAAMLEKKAKAAMPTEGGM